MPATVSVAKRVGTIPPEVDTESISEVRPQYFYYM